MPTIPTDSKVVQLISTHATKSEKMSWERQYRNIRKFMAELDPIEAQIITLLTQKNKLIDQITVTRQQMMQHCIHPKKELVVTDEVATCKFCERTFSIANQTDTSE